MKNCETSLMNVLKMINMMRVTKNKLKINKC